MERTKRSLALLVLLVLQLGGAAAAIKVGGVMAGGDPVRWSASVEQRDSVLQLVFTARIDEGWHIYSTKIPNGGPMPTAFTLLDTVNVHQIGEVREVGSAVTKHDEAFNMELTMFGDSVHFEMPVQIVGSNVGSVRVHAEYQTCRTGQCNYFDTDLTVAIPADLLNVPEAVEEVVTSAPQKKVVVVAQQPAPVEEEKPEEGGMWGFLLISFLAGLAGLLTPCVFPMIPMTVSFFLGKKNRTNALLNAMVFGLSIVAIYTLLGLIVSLTSLGADFVTDVTSHWITNTIFFLLFIVFAASFFGMFEMRLPSSVTTKTDAQADKGGFLGSFFFALTTVIVSLSCVGPIVGALLVEAASGATTKPVLGMFAFALGFSLPFTLFAIFPQMLNKLPKSGGWMNSVKIVLGYIVLAFSLKFLLNVDVALGLGWISRPLFISIWVVFCFLLGAYLMGWLRFKMDSKLETVGFFRMLLAGAAFVCGLLLLRGLFGAPLTSLSGFLPEDREQHAFVGAIGAGSTSGSAAVSYEKLCDTPKFADFLTSPAGLVGYFDYNQALECAKKQRKPLLVEFSGHTCANCKEMAAKVLSKPAVNQLIRDEFILVTLYVDDRYELPEAEWYESTLDGKMKKTMGKQNLDLLATKFKASGQPLFFVVGNDGAVLTEGMGRELNVDVFKTWLQEGLDAFKKR